MEKICQTCGDKGFSGPLIYCAECWDTVEHIYCLGIPVDDITDDFSWTCNSCKSADNLLPKILVYGNESNEDATSAGYGPLRVSDPGQLDASAMQVVGPIWRGSFNTTDKSFGSFREMELFMPKTSYSNAVKIARSVKPSLYFHMKRRSTVWPKHFDDIGVADSNFGICILPANSSGETDYNNLVEYMIEYDLAMTADLAGLKLTVFTSLELLTFEKHKIQGKYYLWGALKEKKSKRVPSKYFKSNAAKKRTGKGVKKVGGPLKRSIKPKFKTKRKKTRNLASLLMLNCIPPLKPDVKRARSKSGKKRNNLKKDSEVQIIEGNFLDEHRAPSSNAGLKKRPLLEDEHVSCMNPVIIEKENLEASNCPTTASTVPLELSDEESTRCGLIASTVVMEFNDEETTMCGSTIQNREASASIPASILEMAGEYHETSSSRFIQVGRYTIKSDLAPILSNILANHGDIALGCMTDPTIPLEEICKVVQELKSLRLSGLRFHHVNHLKNVMQLAEVVGIDVKWLFQRCDDLEKLVSHLSQYPTLKNELAQSKKHIQHKEELLSLKRAKVEKHQVELMAMEETIESLKECTEKS